MTPHPNVGWRNSGHWDQRDLAQRCHRRHAMKGMPRGGHRPPWRELEQLVGRAGGESRWGRGETRFPADGIGGIPARARCGPGISPGPRWPPGHPPSARPPSPRATLQRYRPAKLWAGSCPLPSRCPRRDHPPRPLPGNRNPAITKAWGGAAGGMLRGGTSPSQQRRPGSSPARTVVALRDP